MEPLDKKLIKIQGIVNLFLLNFQEYCQIGVKEGAQLVYGGKQADRPGLYMEPTIFADVEDHMFLAKVESNLVLI